MSIIVRKNGATRMLVKPAEFRRVYTLSFTEGDSQVVYSHTDVVVELENGSRAMLEIIQGQLHADRYIVEMLPTEASFDFTLFTGGDDGSKCMQYLKKLIFMTFPDLHTKDVYLNEDLEQRRS